MNRRSRTLVLRKIKDNIQSGIWWMRARLKQWLSDRPRKNRDWNMASEVIACEWDDYTANAGTDWWAIPSVRQRWDRLITDNSAQTYFEYVVEKYFAALQPRRALSLCCGDGDWERRWATYYSFELVHGIDLSPQRIARAREAAAERGLHFSYEVGDANGIHLTDEQYDVVLVKQPFHHLSELEHVFSEIEACIRPRGLLILHEYVGPSRFQWSDRQVEVVNAALDLLPAQYRRSISKWPALKQQVVRPSVKEMLRIDPSEACRSEDIPSLLRRYFTIVEWKKWGGTLLHLLLQDIAGNFSEAEWKDMLWLNLCFQIEDTLLASGDLGSDFVFAVCKSRES